MQVCKRVGSCNTHCGKLEVPVILLWLKIILQKKKEEASNLILNTPNSWILNLFFVRHNSVSTHGTRFGEPDNVSTYLLNSLQLYPQLVLTFDIGPF